MSTLTLLGSFAKGDSWLDIVTAATSIVALGGGAIYFAWQAFRWKFGGLEISYFLPKERYRRTKFEGAGPNERRLKRLVLSTQAKYLVTIEFRAKTNIDIGQARFVINDTAIGEENHPIDLGELPSKMFKKAHPDLTGRQRYEDWNGEVKLIDEFNFPRFIVKDDTGYLTHRIETRGEWTGELRVLVMSRGVGGRLAGSRTFALPLEIRGDRDRDEAPFLKNWEPGA